jgi:nitroreductase
MASLLRYASLAPSGHNTQPWSVRATGPGLIIGSDPARWLPKVDPQNREMALSIGAFLENLLLAAPGHGYRASVVVTASSARDGELVQVTLTPAGETDRDALEQIRRRRTVRSGQLRRPLSSKDLRELLGYFGEHGHYFPLASKEGRYLAEGTIEANRAQALRDDAQAELAMWIRFRNEDGRAHGDGLTPESMEIHGFAGWYVRHFMNRESVMGKSFRDEGVDRVREQVASCGGWMVVTSPDGALETLLATGRRTERMWLAVRGLQIAIHPMTQLLEELPFREQIGKELGIRNPIQFLLRVGYVENYPEPVSLRRPVAAMLCATGCVDA